MKGKFCPKCGATDKPFYKGFCIGCYLHDHPGVAQAEPVSLRQCPKCLRVFSKGSWESGRPESIEDIIQPRIKTRLESPSVSIERVGGNTKKEEYEATVTGVLGGETVSVVLPVEVSYEKDTCDVCSRKSGNYYEALIQLRPRGQEFSPERMKTALDFLRNEARSLVKKDRNAEIFYFEPDKNGVDVFFGSARVAKIALQHFQSTYRPVVKESYTLVGVDRASGKRRYRVTFSVRI